MKFKSLLSLSLIIGITAARPILAVCPVCVVAVGAGLGLSRWLGVDDLVSSLWIGGILLALTIWTINWLRKKDWSFKFMPAIVALVYYGLTILPMYFYGIIGHPANTFWGVDKILFGTVLGTALFLAANWASNYLKSKNNGKPYFPYQKVVLPFSTLLLVSIILWLTI